VLPDHKTVGKTTVLNRFVIGESDSQIHFYSAKRFFIHLILLIVKTIQHALV